VERVLTVLDGAVLVISAVEGVQAQTKVLMRTLRRLGIPVIIFVNKIDRRGARYDQVLREISAKLAPAIIAMDAPRGLGSAAPGSPRSAPPMPLSPRAWAACWPGMTMRYWLPT
jgi:ribosomal protection tetracycline resistance protein